MKLRYSPTSPYVRKVSVTAIELGLAGQIERIQTNTQDRDSGIAEHNPLGKVPALILDDGSVLYDSPVICEYLDSLHDGPKLFPAAGPARWTALRQQALGDGILDAAILRMIETLRRPEALRWQGWIDHQSAKVVRAVDRLQAEAAELQGGFADPLTIGGIAAGCALGYLDFRAPELEWRAGRTDLAAWYEDFSQRPSMRETLPQAPQ
jgi:glutathione S-transferase